MNITRAVTTETKVTMTPADLGATLGTRCSDEQADALWHFIEKLAADDHHRRLQLEYIRNTWTEYQQRYMADMLSQLTGDAS